MPLRDSIDKIVSVYLAGVTAQEFEYKGRRFFPKLIHVSPLIFRGFTCPSGCGGCCPRFSLDYLPGDLVPPDVTEREVIVSNRKIGVRSDVQMDHDDHFCRHLDRESGRCNVYSRRPFSCDFELIRFLHYQDKVVITQKLFGRGWAMKRIDGERGAKCEMLVTNPHWIAEVQRKIDRLGQWGVHFRLETRVDQISRWVASGPHTSPLIISSEGSQNI